MDACSFSGVLLAVGFRGGRQGNLWFLGPSLSDFDSASAGVISRLDRHCFKCRGFYLEALSLLCSFLLYPFALPLRGVASLNVFPTRRASFLWC